MGQGVTRYSAALTSVANLHFKDTTLDRYEDTKDHNMLYLLVDDNRM